MNNKILIADDEKINRIVIRENLRTGPDEYILLYASDGQEAIELAIQEKPDLILMDWMMPGTSGIEAVKEIKNNPSTKDIPIIMLTSLIESDNLRLAFDVGVSDYIKKPFDRVELLSRVKSVLDLYLSINEIKKQKEIIQNQSKKIHNSNFELKLKNKELERLSLVASKTDNAVIILSPEGKLEWVNEGFIRIYGLNLSDFKSKIGKSIYEVSKNDNIKEIVAECLEKKESVLYVSHIQNYKGETLWLQTNLTPIFDDNEEYIQKLIAVESDISELKETEFSLQNKNELLEQQKKQISLEKRKSDDLLLNILPEQTASELKAKGFSVPRFYKTVSVLFTDFVNFTSNCEDLKPEELVNELDTYFAEFDEIVEKHYVEKIKTIGDAYMCAGGIPIRNKSNPIDTVLAGLEIQEFMTNLNKFKKAAKLPTWELRLGINTGEIIAGIVGKKKFAYDIWGDTVNVAARIETQGEPGLVNISAFTYDYIKEFFDCTPRGEISVKNKGNIEMYFVNRLKPEFSKDDKGIYPNDDFMKKLSMI